MKEQIEKTRTQIIEAFAPAERPSKKHIATHECEECGELRETFADLEWNSIPAEIIDSNFGQLPLFSARAYHYFLPAYILRCLDEFDSSNMVCEFTIYSLSPSLSTQEDRKWFSERQRQFTETQRGAITAFLKLIKATEEFVDFHKDIEVGIRHWENAQTKDAT
jgi:hypothetical protein